MCMCCVCAVPGEGYRHDMRQNHASMPSFLFSLLERNAIFAALCSEALVSEAALWLLQWG